MTDPERVIPTGLLDFVENWPLAVLTASGVFFGFLFWIKQGLPLGAALFLDFIASVAIGMAARRAVLSYLGQEVTHERRDGTNGEEQGPSDLGIGQHALHLGEDGLDRISYSGRDHYNEDEERPIGISPSSEHVVAHDLDPARSRLQQGPKNQVGRHVGDHRTDNEGTPERNRPFQHGKTEDCHGPCRKQAGSQKRAPRYDIACRIHGTGDHGSYPSPFSWEAAR